MDGTSNLIKKKKIDVWANDQKKKGPYALAMLKLKILIINIIVRIWKLLLYYKMGNKPGTAVGGSGKSQSVRGVEAKKLTRRNLRKGRSEAKYSIQENKIYQQEEKESSENTSINNGEEEAEEEDTSQTAASVIQEAWKKHKDKETDEEVLTHWKLFNDLENREEADVLQLSQFLNALSTYMPKDMTDSNRATRRRLSVNYGDDIDITELYKGVHIDSTVTLKNALDLIESFKNGEKLHVKYVTQIVTDVTAYFNTLPNVKRCSIAPAEHITLVGDLHGQLQDLLLIFRENGVPSEKNPYVFNGDIVDRGPKSIEIALILFCFQLLYPNSVHINRGNHEDRAITMIFGFMKECHEKYDETIYELFAECFDSMQLCTLIDNRIFVIHAGISRYEITLDKLDQLPRSEYELAVVENEEVVGLSSKLKKHKEQQIEILRDLLWSDPQSSNGWKKNKRGAGINYGPDVVAKFLKKNKLQLIVRSHECVPQGYHWPYADRGLCVTLFSASNYCGKANNIGAFMRIPGSSKMKSCFYQYIAESPQGVATQVSGDASEATVAESVRRAIDNKNLVVDNLHGLFSVIVEYKNELLSCFEHYDRDKAGRLTTILWCKAMEEVLQMNLSWMTILPLITSLDADGFVPYVEFLDRYNAEGNFKMIDSQDKIEGNETPSQLANRRLFNNLYKHRTHLEAIFHIFDANKDGIITKEEFATGIELLNKNLPPSMAKFKNSDELMKLLDFSNDEKININEFMESFRITAKLTLHAKWKRVKTKLHAVSRFNTIKKSLLVSIPKVDMNETSDEANEENRTDEQTEQKDRTDSDCNDFKKFS